MQTAARVARTVAPVAAAGVAATVSSGPAHADAPAASLDVQPVRRKITDEWELASVDAKNVVLFSPADIDSAVSLLTRPCHPHTAAIEERPSDSSDCSTDGAAADEIIQRSTFDNSSDSSSITRYYGLDASLFTVAARLLKSPGVQREIVQAALADPEVFDILASKCDLPGYLGSQGLAARGLLTDSAAAVQDGHNSSCTIDGEDSGSSNIIEELSGWIADTVEGVGLAVERLGRWIRSKLLGEQQQQEAEAGARADSSSRARTRRVGDGAIGGIGLGLMVAMVAIIAMALLKKPVSFRRMPRSV